METFAISIAAAAEQLRKENGQKFTVLMQHHSMRLEYFAPSITDTQTPHLQDEMYVIASGHSTFYRNGQQVACQAGDVLFVPAAMEHHFENFSEDFATWVIFYGPEGGEEKAMPF